MSPMRGGDEEILPIIKSYPLYGKPILHKWKTYPLYGKIDSLTQIAEPDMITHDT